MLTEEQAEDIRAQLLEQIESFPEDKREELKEKILNMTNEDLEAFLKQNQEAAQTQAPQGKQCIFCLIIEGKMPSHKIAEEKEEIAVLEINPLSKGHTLILPKRHLETTKISRSSFSLAKKIAERIKEKLNPEDIKISTSNIFGHALIEIIPVYKGETISQRKKADEKQLLELQDTLKIIKRDSKPRIKKPKAEVEVKEEKHNLPKVKPRIP